MRGRVSNPLGQTLTWRYLAST